MAAVEQGLCAARVYQWSEATVSLGYFQDAAAVSSSALSNLPMVRRLSGGGAILHHLELTYSCVVPAGHHLAAEPGTLYEVVHEAIIALLARHGILARMRQKSERLKDTAFLCFGRGDPRDVLVDGHKILGSAQRRRRGAILQHGSLLLRRSPHAPQFPGVLDLVPDAARHLVDAANELAHEVASSLGGSIGAERLDEAIKNRAVVLERAKYRSLDWRGNPSSE